MARAHRAALVPQRSSIRVTHLERSFHVRVYGDRPWTCFRSEHHEVEHAHHLQGDVALVAVPADPAGDEVAPGQQRILDLSGDSHALASPDLVVDAAFVAERTVEAEDGHAVLVQ